MTTTQPPPPPTMSLAAALDADDRRAVQVQIDQVLAAQHRTAPKKQRMDALRQWIEAQDGVLEAEVNRVVLRTMPPVQQIWIKLESNPEKIRTVGVVLDGESLRFDIK